MAKILYTDLMEYANDIAAQTAWVTDASGLELDYMEYASDGAAQAAYVSSDSDATKLLLHLNNSVTDSSPSGHTVNNNNVTFSSGTKKFGSHSAYFNGSTAYLDIDDSADWDILIQTNFTLDFWINFTDHPSGVPEYLFDQFEESDNRWALKHDDDNGGFNFFAKSGGVTIIDTGSGGEVEDSNWHHIALIKVGNEYGIYKDGNQVCHDSSSDTDTFASSLYIGAAGVPSAYFDGYMDDVRITHDNAFGASPVVGLTDTIVVPTSEHSLVDNLQCYSEASIKNQGSYSLKAIALQTDSLNETLTKSGLSIDLSGKSELKIDFYALRTGTNIQMQIHDSGGTTSTKNIAISVSNTWETTTWDISGIADVDKDNIDQIIIKIINADSANTFYVDNFRSEEALQCYSEDTIKQQGSYSLKVIAAQTGSLNKTLTKTLTDYLDYSIMDVIRLEIRGSRTGSNVKLKIHDTGGTTSEHTINIASANTWQTETWDISGIATGNRDTIDKIIIEISNADAVNTLYFDNMYSKAIVESSHVFLGG